MTLFDSTMEQVSAFWLAHAPTVVVAALVAALGLVVVTFLSARRRGRIQPWLANLSTVAVLGLSAEGMWMVATKKLDIPAVIAAGVFFVAEALLVNEALLARKHLREHGHPGRHGTAVWVIAVVSGVIVATNATSVTEFLLRLALPLAAAWMWHAGLTSEQSAERGPGRWRWTPRRLLIQLGAITAEAQDVEQINREQTVRTMTRLARRVHHDPRPGRLAARRRLRSLERLALQADDAMLADVQRRVRRAARVTELTDPDQTASSGSVAVGVDERGTTSPATEPVSGHDGSSASGQVSGHEDNREPEGCPDAHASDVRTVTRPDTATDVLREATRLRRQNPDITATELQQAIAETLGVTSRTVRRHLSAKKSSNGHHLQPVPDLDPSNQAQQHQPNNQN